MKNWLKNLGLRFCKPTGVLRKECSFCGSNNINVKRFIYIKPPFEIPQQVKVYSDQLTRRDNGVCTKCGLEQSFYVFSESARTRFHELGLDILGSDSGLLKYPPDYEFIKSTFNLHFSKRFEKWNSYFNERKIGDFSDVLFLRPYYGCILERFRETFDCNLYSKDVIQNCEKYLEENLSFVNVLGGNIFGGINISTSKKFDLIICFHTITHSINLYNDLLKLKNLLSENGIIIFCDEITKKKKNTFHMIHLDESIFSNILQSFFKSVDRIDGCGNVNRFIKNYTFKGDNPDIVAFK